MTASPPIREVEFSGTNPQGNVERISDTIFEANAPLRELIAVCARALARSLPNSPNLSSSRHGLLMGLRPIVSFVENGSSISESQAKRLHRKIHIFATVDSKKFPFGTELFRSMFAILDAIASLTTYTKVASSQLFESVALKIKRCLVRIAEIFAAGQNQELVDGIEYDTSALSCSTLAAATMGEPFSIPSRFGDLFSSDIPSWFSKRAHETLLGAERVADATIDQPDQAVANIAQHKSGRVIFAISESLTAIPLFFFGGILTWLLVAHLENTVLQEIIVSLAVVIPLVVYTYHCYRSVSFLQTRQTSE